MSTEKNIKIRQRVDEETNWVTKNPTLLKNETAYSMSGSVTSVEDYVNGYTARGIKIGRTSSDKQNWSDAPWLYHSGDEYITWGGRDTYANYHGPLDATMIKEMGNSNNLLAFIKPSAISIEYSIDGGETWLDKNISDIVKQQMVTCAPGNTTQDIYVGDLTSENYSDTNRYAQKTDQLRVTIDARLASLYCSIDKIALQVNGIWLDDKYYATFYTSFDGETWTQRGDKALICGWPGWNVLNRTYENIYINGWGTTYPRYFRITFVRESEPPTSGNNTHGLGLRSMAIYGRSVWNCSFLQYNKLGHLYTYDVDKNVNFPAELHATSALGVNSYKTATGITITPSEVINNYAINDKYTNVTGNWDFNDNLKVSSTLNANDIFTKHLELVDNQAQCMTMTPTTVELPSYLAEGYTETTVHGQLIFDSHDLTSEFKGKLLYNDNEVLTTGDACDTDYIPQNIIGMAVDRDQQPSPGTSTQYARADHTHSLPDTFESLRATSGTIDNLSVDKLTITGEKPYIVDWITQIADGIDITNNEIGGGMFYSHGFSKVRSSTAYQFCGYYLGYFFYCNSSTVIATKNYGQIYNPAFSYSLPNAYNYLLLTPNGEFYGAYYSSSSSVYVEGYIVDCLTGEVQGIFTVGNSSVSRTITHMFYLNGQVHIILSNGTYIFPVYKNTLSNTITQLSSPIYLSTNYQIFDNLQLFDDNNYSITYDSEGYFQTRLSGLIVTEHGLISHDDIANYNYLNYCNNDLGLKDTGSELLYFSTGYTLDDNNNFTLILPNKQFTFPNKYLSYYIDGEQAQYLHLLRTNGKQDVFEFTR